MKRTTLALILAALAAPALADVGLSVSVDQPGVYGRIDIGNSEPPPQVIYSQPVVVEAIPGPPPAPIYLHVPPGHERHWRHHCAEYNACGQPVYFVHDDWYRTQYVPRHPEYRHDDRDYDRRDHDHGHDHGDDHGHGHDEDHDHGHDH